MVCRVADFASCEWWQTIGGDRGGCTLTLPADSVAVSRCGIMNVIRITDDDGSVYEYYINGPLEDGPDMETVIVRAADISVRMGQVRLSQTVGGIENFALTPGLRTITDHINTYILPALAAAGLTWIVLGTITPTGTYTVTPNRSTPLEYLAALEDASKFEFWLEFNADTNYRIMFGRRTASGTPVAWVGRNVETLRRRITADEKFFNRAIPCAATLSGETEATHIGQNGWKLSTVAGDNLTLAHPQAGGTAPIGADDQLNGLVAGLSIDGITFPDVDYGGFRGVAYDPTRKRVAVIARDAALGTFSVYWRKLDDNTCGKTAIGGSTDLRAIVYDAGRDEFLVSCNDASKVERLTASTMASAGNIATHANPSTLSNLNQAGGINQLAVGSTSVAAVQIWNLAALTLAGTIGTTTNNWVIYDANATYYFCYGPGNTWVQCYDATYVFVRHVAVFGGTAQVAAGGDSNNSLWFVSIGNHIQKVTATTGATGTDTTLPSIDGSAISVTGIAGTYGNRFMPYLGSKLYLQCGAGTGDYLAILDPASSFAVSGYTRLPKGNNAEGAGSTGQNWIYESTNDVFVGSAQVGLVALVYRNGLTVPSGRLRMAVQDTVLSTQVIVKPSATKGPIFTDLDVEIRADASDTYQRQLTDPVSLATYGPVDGFPLFTDLYKRNYKHDPTNDVWASNRPVWLGMFPTHNTNLSSVGQPKWVAAEAQASARSTTGLVDTTQALGAGVVSLKIKGLAAGRVIQPGDLINGGPSFPAWAMARVVADGSGNVTVSIYQLQSQTWTNGNTVTIWSPAASDTLGANMVANIIYGPGGGATAVYPFQWTGACHVPRISAATQAWVRASFACLQGGANLNTLSLAVKGYGNNTTLTPSSLTQGSYASPVYVDVTLEQQVSLTATSGDDFLQILITIPQQTYSQFLQLYLKSIEVYVATSATCPTPLGRKRGDELTPWIAANDLLFNQGRSAPTVDYQVQFIEDGTVVKIGQTAMLRDPARGVAASPRVMQVRRQIRRDAFEVARPVVQLSNRQLSAMEALAGVGD
ncbi:MAG: hypothetical protein U9Q74_16850 [Gemmatimonadota bacterium]|nr:hypothetical protein [Gemmatimonadota bacterium]